MILSRLELYNFRKFKSEDEQPGLVVDFHEGLNVLVGENNAGKTAIIDAIKIALQPQGNKNAYVTNEDFYVDDFGVAVEEFRIKIIFDNMTEREATEFARYCSCRKNAKTNKYEFYLQLMFCAKRKNGRIFGELRAGGKDGVLMRADARELLRVVYLKPLRDANREMRSGYNSRFSQILSKQSCFSDGENNKLVETMKEANGKIENYFSENEDGGSVLGGIREVVEDASITGDSGSVRIIAADVGLKGVLESLSLVSGSFNPGLGETNLLFIAAELLLLKDNITNGPNVALIEEIEAHLSPQAQEVLIAFLQKKYRDSGVQIIISTHSITLASNVNLQNFVLIAKGKSYNLDSGSTKLSPGDYLFLQRFLSATKANMFFARGVILVEGDAEAILVPVIADIIGLPLAKNSISIVNVQSKAFLRYSGIFARKDEEVVPISVSVVTDCDVKPVISDDGKVVDVLSSKSELAIGKIKEKHEIAENIKAFVASLWTLEYTLANSCLFEYVQKAILYAKRVQNSDKCPIAEDKVKEIEEEIANQNKQWNENGATLEQKAFEICKPVLGEKATVSKAIAAQCLAVLLQRQTLIVPEGTDSSTDLFNLDMVQWRENKEAKASLKNEIENDERLSYIVNAIKHAARREDG